MTSVIFSALKHKLPIWRPVLSLSKSLQMYVAELLD